MRCSRSQAGTSINRGGDNRRQEEEEEEEEAEEGQGFPSARRRVHDEII
jgi:hypothetical protein